MFKTFIFVEQTFLNSLSSFEQSLLGFTGDPCTVDILALLGVNPVVSKAEGDGVVIPTPESTLSSFDFQKICSVLCAYRFFDIISLRAGCTSHVSASPPVPMNLPGSPGPKDDLHVSL